MFSGILLINKPKNITSFEVINRIKKNFKIKKIGHAGTLDSFATGLLIAGINEGTKLLTLFMEREKVYVATFVLGKTTDTLDETGTVINEYSVPLPDITIIKQEIKSFVGELLQVPPVFSAIKIKGKRASDLVRMGEKIEIEPRVIKISDISIVDYNLPEITVKIKCSKGTYVRAIARDLGEKLNTGAYVKELQRIEISPFSINDARSLDEILSYTAVESLALPLLDATPFLKKIEVSEKESHALKKGVKILKTGILNEGKMLAVKEKEAVAIVDVEFKDNECMIKPVRVFN